jgi:hypothetical protein
MKKSLNQFLDHASEFLAHRKGLLPFLGIFLVLGNLVFVFFLPNGWFAHTNLFLHLGVIVSILGVLLAWAL